MAAAVAVTTVTKVATTKVEVVAAGTTEALVVVAVAVAVTTAAKVATTKAEVVVARAAEALATGRDRGHGCGHGD